MHVRLSRAKGLIALLAVGLLATGAAIAGTARHAARVKVVAIATPDISNDYGWDQQGLLSAASAAGTFGAKLTKVTNIGYDKTQVVLTQLAKSGANFIIAHASGFDTVAARVGQQYKVPVITYDIPTMLVKNYVSNITTQSQQGSYLAGILAARMTKTHHVGIVISASDPNWYKMSGGFAAGVRSIDKTAKISFAAIGPAQYSDAAGGKRTANSIVATGADVILTMGDGATFGYLQAIETANVGHKVWMIGDIGNLTPIDTHHVFLSSVLWTFTNAFKAAITDINKGTYGTHGYQLTLKNGGISLLRTKYIPTSVWKEIGKAKLGIVNGTIHVPDVTTKAAVLKLIG
jgi:simple sugar transport system substrate-binding protein